jgi:hypothetical protein
LNEIFGEDAAKALQTSVEEETNVPRAETCYLTDFLIAEPLLEL